MRPPIPVLTITTLDFFLLAQSFSVSEGFGVAVEVEASVV